jgi:20S proteasome subunit alpha 6
MRNQALQSKLVHARPLPLNRLVHSLSLKAQHKTQISGARPYGVGLLIVGTDATGPHLWEFLPSGSVLEYRATSIGARSQSARTYLEREFESFATCTKEELVMHGLKALRECLPQEKELNVQNTTVAVVGRGEKFVVDDDENVAPWLELLGGEVGSTRARQAKERENAERAAPGGQTGGGSGDDSGAPGSGDAMQTD